MLKYLFKPKEEVVLAPIGGKLVSVTELPDPTFAQKMVGDGFAVYPSDDLGEIISPVAGKVGYIADSKHALSITTTGKADILLHFGIDTVTLNGEGIECMVQPGQKVKTGELLMKVDLSLYRSRNFDIPVIVVCCNKDSLCFDSFPAKTVKRGKNVGRL